jgi:hypothetical protein
MRKSMDFIDSLLGLSGGVGLCRALPRTFFRRNQISRRR